MLHKRALTSWCVMRLLMDQWEKSSLRIRKVPSKQFYLHHFAEIWEMSGLDSVVKKSNCFDVFFVLLEIFHNIQIYISFSKIFLKILCFIFYIVLFFKSWNNKFFKISRIRLSFHSLRTNSLFPWLKIPLDQFLGTKNLSNSSNSVCYLLHILQSTSACSAFGLMNLLTTCSQRNIQILCVCLTGMIHSFWNRQCKLSWCWSFPSSSSRTHFKLWLSFIKWNEHEMLIICLGECSMV